MAQKKPVLREIPAINSPVLQKVPVDKPIVFSIILMAEKKNLRKEQKKIIEDIRQQAEY